MSNTTDDNRDMPDSELFYVQDARNIVGNCMSWWGENGKGYTCNLQRAGKYTADQVRRMRADIDIPWPVEYANEHSIQHTRGDTRPFYSDNPIVAASLKACGRVE